jgi:hypothetical protein
MKRFTVALIAAALAGCGAGAAPEPRSPSTDYPPAVSETANGEVVGADRVAPEDKLATSPRVGSEGVAAAARPGHGGSGASSEPSAPSTR